MNRHETNKTNMCKSVISTFDENSRITTNYTVFVEPVTRLRETVFRINEVDKRFIIATGGKTAIKINAEEDLLDDLMPVKSGLYAWAVRTKNEVIRALAINTETELKRMRDADFLKIAENIKAEAQAHLAELEPYKITEQVLSELQEKIDSFSAGLSGQDTGISSRSALRKELDALFDEADKILTEELDNLVELVRKTNRLFYDQYWAARGIKDLGGGKKPGNNNVQTPPAPDAAK